ncbi:MAG: hypothetical protein ABSA12_11825 [Verrucomicrobiia bacterium]
MSIARAKECQDCGSACPKGWRAQVTLPKTEEAKPKQIEVKVS